MRERILSISLFSILIFQSIFSILYYELGRYQCHQYFLQSRDNIHNDKIHTFIFESYSSIDWEKKDREFFLKGKLYDVISIQTNNSSIVIKCLPDAKEDSILNTHFKSLQRPEKNDQENNMVARLLDLKYLVPEFYLASFTNAAQRDLLVKNETIKFSIYPEIISPPPNNYLFI